MSSRTHVKSKTIPGIETGKVRPIPKNLLILFEFEEIFSPDFLFSLIQGIRTVE